MSDTTEVKEQTEVKKTHLIQQDYARLCTTLGDLFLKMEVLKSDAARINEDYKKALLEEAQQKQ